MSPMPLRCLAVLLALAGPAASAQPYPEIVSRTSLGGQPGDVSWNARVTPDGRYIAFASMAPNVVPADTNGFFDVFVRDRVLGVTERVSVGDGEQQGNGDSGFYCFPCNLIYGLDISADGRYVVFVSDATNLVAGDTNGRRDAFVRDRVAGTTQRLSVSSAELQGDESTNQVRIAANGRYVAFQSESTNLVAGDTNRNLALFQFGSDVFVRDLVAGTTERVSVRSDETQGTITRDGSYEPAITPDGRYVAFASDDDLAPGFCSGQCGTIYVRDRTLGTTETVSLKDDDTPAAGMSQRPALSSDARYVSFTASSILAPGDTDGLTEDIYVRDRVLGTTEHISEDSAGRDATIASEFSSIADGGRYVVFTARHLAPDETQNGDDVYVRDRVLRQTVRISVAADMTPPNSASSRPHATPDGRFVVFESVATNLVPGDANARGDVFIAENPFLVDPSSRVASDGNLATRAVKVSGDGRYLFFESDENGLVPGDANGRTDIFRRDLSLGALIQISVDDAGTTLVQGGSDYSVSRDGMRIAFTSIDDGTLVAKRAHGTAGAGQKVVLLRSLIENITRLIGPGAAAALFDPVISASGETIAFVSPDPLAPGDTNGMDDVFVADADTGVVMERVSEPANGAEPNGPSADPAISADGNVVVFETQATNLVPAVTDTNSATDVVVIDRALIDAIYASKMAAAAMAAAGPSYDPQISDDGNTVVFASDATNLEPGDANAATDVFLVDVGSESATRVSETATGGEANGPSTTPVISGDATVIAFTTVADNLAPEDDNDSADIVTIDLETNVRRRIARTDGGTEHDAASERPSLSRNGQLVAFASASSNVSLADTNGTVGDAFVNGDPIAPALLFRNGFE